MVGAETILEPHEVADFYAKRNVLITGATGFLGKLVTEKLLRVCPNVDNLFLILRAKKGKSCEARLKELFNDVIFDRLKEENPQFLRKVVLIEGDIEKIGLGLSPEHRKLLRTTHIVLHGAATIRFNEPIRQAANINVRGTMELVSLATEMPDLKAFVHVSTAYSNCPRELIGEKFYPPPMDAEKLLSLTDILDDAALEHLTPVLLGKWPNTYAFTKAIAEDAVRRSTVELPLCVVRPSMVISTSREPVAGWVSSPNGPIRVLFDITLGVTRSMYCDRKLIADLIPADYVINGIIVAAWDIDKTRRTNRNDDDPSTAPDAEEFPIYNVVSSCQKPITWEQLMRHVEEAGKQVPSVECLWYYCLWINKHHWIHDLCVILLHFTPAVIYDIAAWSVGKKPVLTAAYRKVQTYTHMLCYFTTRQWRFRNDRTMRMWKRLSSADRADYDLDMTGLDWEHYLHSLVRGMRIHLLKDPMDTLPHGCAKYAKLKVAHYTLLTILCGIVVLSVWYLSQILASW